MPTLFERQFENHEIIKCLNKLHEGCEWVLNGEGYATEKLDGTCCMIKNKFLKYKKYIYYTKRSIVLEINIKIIYTIYDKKSKGR